MRLALKIFAIVVIVVGAFAGVLAWLYVTPAPFLIQVNTRPTSPMGENIMALPGQRCIFSAAATDEQGLLMGKAGLRGIVEVSAQASEGTTAVTVQPRQVTPGQVAEVIVIPTEASVDKMLTVTITGKRFGLTRTETITIEVISGEDSLGPRATEMRDLFIPWLTANHPELGITTETEWTKTIVNPRAS